MFLERGFAVLCHSAVSLCIPRWFLKWSVLEASVSKVLVCLVWGLNSLLLTEESHLCDPTSRCSVTAGVW